MADIQLQTVLSSGDVTQLKLDAIGTPPARSEGLFYYDDNAKTIVLYNDIAGTALDLGREFRRRVFNNSGAQIDNGEVVRVTGYDATSGLPEVEKAIADNYVNAFAGGMMTHDVADGAEGEMTAAGIIHDMDTSGLVAGAPCFLDPSTAGALTQAQPDIPTVMGLPLTSDAATGKFMVSVHPVIQIPDIYGALHEKAGNFEIPVASTWYDLAGFTTSDSNIATVNATNGTINIPYAGYFRVSINLDMALPGSNSGVDYMYIRLWNDTDSTVVSGLNSSILLAPAAPAASRSIGVPMQLEASKNYIVQISSSEAFAAPNYITFNMCTFDVETLKVNVI